MMPVAPASKTTERHHGAGLIPPVTTPNTNRPRNSSADATPMPEAVSRVGLDDGQSLHPVVAGRLRLLGIKPGDGGVGPRDEQCTAAKQAQEHDQART